MMCHYFIHPLDFSKYTNKCKITIVRHHYFPALSLMFPWLHLENNQKHGKHHNSQTPLSIYSPSWVVTSTSCMIWCTLCPVLHHIFHVYTRKAYFYCTPLCLILCFYQVREYLTNNVRTWFWIVSPGSKVLLTCWVQAFSKYLTKSNLIIMPECKTDELISISKGFTGKSKSNDSYVFEYPGTQLTKHRFNRHI